MPNSWLFCLSSHKLPHPQEDHGTIRIKFHKKSVCFFSSEMCSGPDWFRCELMQKWKSLWEQRLFCVREKERVVGGWARTRNAAGRWRSMLSVHGTRTVVGEWPQSEREKTRLVHGMHCAITAWKYCSLSVWRASAFFGFMRDVDGSDMRAAKCTWECAPEFQPIANLAGTELVVILEVF